MGHLIEKIPRALQATFFTPAVYGTVASLALLIAFWQQADRTADKVQSKFEPNVDKFDFIIVGGGTAGSVVASRLSQWYSVLLLEAGGEPHPLQSIPAFALVMPNYPQIDWSFKTVPQRRSCFACTGGKSSWSAGKGLGGTGNLDLMIHLRGHPKDYDNWAIITGDPTWSYEGVLPFFRRYEDYFGNTSDPTAHGVDGPVRLELPDYRGMADEFIWAANEIGYPHVDLNGHYDNGYDHVPYPLKRGLRHESYQAYIQTARQLPNLIIRKFAQVTKVLMRGKDNVAYGVEYDRHGVHETAYAAKEVIISSGVVNTPKLLMLSGIGPWQHLKDLGIPVRVDAPVGQNLQDHLATYLGPFFIDKPRSFSIDRDISPQAFAELARGGKGPLTNCAAQAAGLFSSTPAQLRGEGAWPDILHVLIGLSVHKTFAHDLSRAFGFSEDVMKKYYQHAQNKESFFVTVAAGRPIARGEVLLKSRDPTDPPSIDPKYLEDPWDLDKKVMIEGIEKALKLVEDTDSFAELKARFTTEKFPGCEKYTARSAEYWECYIRHYSVSLHHGCCTAAMGATGSPHAVVDNELRVIGTKGLRVIDASVMPTIVSSNTAAATLMIAEKGAELIAKYWKEGGYLLESPGPYAPSPAQFLVGHPDSKLPPGIHKGHKAPYALIKTPIIEHVPRGPAIKAPVPIVPIVEEVVVPVVKTVVSAHVDLEALKAKAVLHDHLVHEYNLYKAAEHVNKHHALEHHHHDLHHHSHHAAHHSLDDDHHHNHKYHHGDDIHHKHHHLDHYTPLTHAGVVKSLYAPIAHRHRRDVQNEGLSKIIVPTLRNLSVNSYPSNQNERIPENSQRPFPLPVNSETTGRFSDLAIAPHELSVDTYPLTSTGSPEDYVTGSGRNLEVQVEAVPFSQRILKQSRRSSSETPSHSMGVFPEIVNAIK